MAGWAIHPSALVRAMWRTLVVQWQHVWALHQVRGHAQVTPASTVTDGDLWLRWWALKRPGKWTFTRFFHDPLSWHWEFECSRCKTVVKSEGFVTVGWVAENVKCQCDELEREYT